MAWVLRAGDCLVCGQHVNLLRTVERAEEGSTFVFLIGTAGDTSNLRTLLRTRRVDVPIALVNPALLPPEWQGAHTPDLLVVNATEVLWVMGKSTADLLAVLQRIRETERAGPDLGASAGPLDAK